MRIRLTNLAIFSMISVALVTGCDNSNTTDTVTDSATATEQSAAVNNDIETNSTVDNSTVTTDIDWSKVASSEQAADRANYNYPFDIDSQNVKDYADYFKVDTATAQHNMTVGMASNEALSKVLDQLEGTYTSHELTDGETVELIIHTTPAVKASRYDYVFEDDFAKGLILPIVIQPDGVKSELDAHSGS